MSGGEGKAGRPPQTAQPTGLSRALHRAPAIWRPFGSTPRRA